MEKTRYYIKVEGSTWEVDVFHGENRGFVMAEIELADDAETFLEPGWLGREVTGDVRFYNACLVGHPYRTWPEPKA